MSNDNKKKIIFLQANVTNIYAKFQLYHTYGFWGDDFLNIFFTNLAFRLPWQPKRFIGLEKNDILVEDFSGNISVKCLPIFPIISQWQL